MIGGFQAGVMVASMDPDAIAYLTAVETADGQALEPAVRSAINDFVVGCKADGIWGAIKASCILAGARTLSGALIPLVGSAPTNNGPFVSQDYIRKTGLGDSSNTNKWLNSNRNNNLQSKNNVHSAVYETVYGNIAAIMGCGTTTTESGVMNIGRAASPTRAFSRCQNILNESDLTSATTNAFGLLGVSRSASGQYILRFSGSNNTYTRTSADPYNGNIGIFKITGYASFSASRLAFYSIGESLDLEKLDTRVTALIAAFNGAIA